MRHVGWDPRSVTEKGSGKAPVGLMGASYPPDSLPDLVTPDSAASLRSGCPERA